MEIDSGQASHGSGKSLQQMTLRGTFWWDTKADWDIPGAEAARSASRGAALLRVSCWRCMAASASSVEVITRWAPPLPTGLKVYLQSDD